VKQPTIGCYGQNRWYPGDMPLACVEKILLVRVYKSAPKDNTFLYAHHQLAVEEEKKRRSG
jgi:hypothetical protein